MNFGNTLIVLLRKLLRQPKHSGLFSILFSPSVESLNNYAIIVLKPHLLGITETSCYTDTSCGLVMKLPAVALVTTSSEG